MYAIGVDYHTASSHLTVLDSTGRVVRAGRIGNTAAEVRKLVAPYGNEAEAALEATRNWTVMYDLLEAEVRAVHLVHPLKVRAIAEARVKTDRIDSGILAHLLRCDLLPTAYVRPPAQRATQQLLPRPPRRKYGT
jgi:transposase